MEECKDSKSAIESYECYISHTTLTFYPAIISCLSVFFRLVSLRGTSRKKRKRSLTETAGITFPKATNGRALRNQARPLWPRPLTVVYISTWTARTDGRQPQARQSETVERCGNVASQRGLSGPGLTRGSQEDRLWWRRTSARRTPPHQPWCSLITRWDITSKKTILQMNTHGPVKMECDLWNVISTLHHHLFLTMVAGVLLGMFWTVEWNQETWMKTTGRTCERRKGPGWNQTHNLPALSPLNNKTKEAHFCRLAAFFFFTFKFSFVTFSVVFELSGLCVCECVCLCVCTQSHTARVALYNIFQTEVITWCCDVLLQ